MRATGPMAARLTVARRLVARPSGASINFGILLALLFITSGTGGPTAFAQSGDQVQLLRTESRARFVHRITLYDADGKAIDPADKQAPPYSPRATCGKCHEVGSVSHGWHFNAFEPNAPAGRPGEPWILVDQRTDTVLPLSGRGWPGTFRPEAIGLDAREFVREFGRHLPGGGIAAPAARDALGTRWAISGPLEIDCMHCHSADLLHDQAEIARQIERENYQWAATAALGVGAVRGDARTVPDDFDPLAPPSPDHPERALPTVAYDKSRFDFDNRFLFNVTRRPPAERCYFCHTTNDSYATSRWHSQGDVHIAAGMTCTDCHRNDIGHMIVRGYEGEAEQRKEPQVAALTCAGCHLGHEAPGQQGTQARRAEDERPPLILAGRLGAPRPEHRGIPTLHFEKLACTACHSGPWPDQYPEFVQTSLAHALGIPSREHAATAPPLLAEPIFARDALGRIAPHRAMQPAYWAWLAGETLTPIPIDLVTKAAGNLLPKPSAKHDAAPSLSDEQITGVLAALSRQAPSNASAVRVQNGRVLRPKAGGELESIRHAGADAYLWPLAHNVRPAAQSLGVRGCTDCHADGAPFFFGKSEVADAAGHPRAASQPAAITATAASRRMHERFGYDASLAVIWNTLFAQRDAFKWLGWICVGVVALAFVRTARVMPAAVPSNRHGRAGGFPQTWQRSLWAVALVSLLVLALSGFGGDLRTGAVLGWGLIAHTIMAPLFMLTLALLAIHWSAKYGRPEAPSREGPADRIGPLLRTTVLLAGLASTGSMMLAMTPLFGSDDQRRLYDVHLYGSAIVTVAMLLYPFRAKFMREAVPVALAARVSEGKKDASNEK